MTFSKPAYRTRGRPLAVGDDPLRWSSKVVTGRQRSSKVVNWSSKVVKGRQMVVGGRQRSSKVVKSRPRVLGGASNIHILPQLLQSLKILSVLLRSLSATVSNSLQMLLPIANPYLSSSVHTARHKLLRSASHIQGWYYNSR